MLLIPLWVCILEVSVLEDQTRTKEALVQNSLGYVLELVPSSQSNISQRILMVVKYKLIK